MKKNIWFGILFFSFFPVSAAWAQTSSGPFDGRRLDANAGVPAGLGVPAKPLTAPRRGVFCGLIGDLDSLSICVDGTWISQDEFRLGTGARMVWATGMAVKLSTGEVVEIGGILPKWRMSLKKGSAK